MQRSSWLEQGCKTLSANEGARYTSGTNTCCTADMTSDAMWASISEKLSNFMSHIEARNLLIMLPQMHNSLSGNEGNIYGERFVSGVSFPKLLELFMKAGQVRETGYIYNNNNNNNLQYISRRESQFEAKLLYRG